MPVYSSAPPRADRLEKGPDLQACGRCHPEYCILVLQSGVDLSYYPKEQWVGLVILQQSPQDLGAWSRHRESTGVILPCPKSFCSLVSSFLWVSTTRLTWKNTFYALLFSWEKHWVWHECCNSDECKYEVDGQEKYYTTVWGMWQCYP